MIFNLPDICSFLFLDTWSADLPTVGELKLGAKVHLYRVLEFGYAEREWTPLTRRVRGMKFYVISGPE